MLRVTFELSGEYGLQGNKRKVLNDVEKYISKNINRLEKILNADLQRSGFVTDSEKDLEITDGFYVRFSIGGTYDIDGELTEDSYLEQDDYIDSVIHEVEKVLDTNIRDCEYVINIEKV